MKILSGFESTQIYGSGKDVLKLTRHTEFYQEDLQLVKDSGLDLLRYSAPWHDIERAPGVYDWSWMDKAMAAMEIFGIQPILDPLHHTSFPEWLAGGFAHPEFPEIYLKFVTELAERYSWAKHYTIINEPFVTAFFCGHEGIWYPYQKGGKNFVRQILNVGRAISLVSRMLVEKIPGVKLIHVDACEQHRALNPKAEGFARERNEMRFLVQDLILGKINEEHALYPYLRKKGATKKQLVWFAQNPARIDILGLDYYAHCELEWRTPRRRVYPNTAPLGFAEIAMDYVNRYKLPVMLSETNIRGSVSDRVSWLKFMVEQCEILTKKLKPLGIPFEGFCWYPFIDSCDWCSLVREANGKVDPQGIFRLDRERHVRRSSELSEVFSALARGEITSKDVPAYHFKKPLDRVLKNFLPLMKDWDWQSSAEKPKARTARIAGL